MLVAVLFGGALDGTAAVQKLARPTESGLNASFGPFDQSELWLRGEGTMVTVRHTLNGSRHLATEVVHIRNSRIQYKL